MAKNFGYEVKGASSLDTGKFFASRFVCPDAGILNSVSVYLKNASGSAQNVQVGIYRDQAGVVGTNLIYSASVSIPDAFDDWQVFNLAAFLNLGAAYWFTIQLENSAAIVYLYYDAGVANQQAFKAAWVFGTWSNNPAGLTYSANKISVFATYTPGTPSPYAWGMLAKNQIDPETVEGAIDRIVAVHEADPDSHLEVGESLQSHKAAVIIDHVAGSIIADKVTMSEGLYECTFESLDNWTHDANTVLLGWPGVTSVNIYPGAATLFYTYLATPGFDWLDYSKNILFQFVAWLDHSTNLIFYAHMGRYSGSTPTRGFGFKLIDGVFRGYWQEDSTMHYTDALSFSIDTFYIFRAYYDAVAQNVKFYINGLLVATLEKVDEPVNDGAYVFFSLKKSVSSGFGFYLHKVLVSRTA